MTGHLVEKVFKILKSLHLVKRSAPHRNRHLRAAPLGPIRVDPTWEGGNAGNLWCDSALRIAVQSIGRYGKSRRIRDNMVVHPRAAKPWLLVYIYAVDHLAGWVLKGMEHVLRGI